MLIKLLLAVTLITGAAAHALAAEPCEKAAQGLSKCEFDEVIAKIDRLYRPEFAKLGAQLWMRANWKSNESNAHANEWGRWWLLSFTGGLARKPGMTRDAYAMVACHEVGHHLGGTPKLFLSALASEGQADYFTTLKCARKFFADEDNAAALRGKRFDIFVMDECNRAFEQVNDRLICIRSTAASKTLVEVLQVINKDETRISFRTPDISLATPFAVFEHPGPQCRLDTFLNGARCAVSADLPLSKKNFETGSCDRKGEPPNEGSRPRCWFRP
jgi:hypothetical protein